LHVIILFFIFFYTTINIIYIELVMNIIKYSKFHDTLTLKKTILEVMNKLLNYDETYQRVIFGLLMDEISSVTGIKKLSYEYSARAGYWKLHYGPIHTVNLDPEHLGSYYITILKYFDTKNYQIKVISVKDYIIKELKKDLDDWIENNDKKDNCIIV
jgi:hypothetical protein